MDKVIVPTNLLSWPKIKNLIPDHKLIILSLWQNPFVTACGAYQIDLDMYSAMLGFNKPNVEQAINDFVKMKLIEFDHETAELLIVDWWRFHQCKTGMQVNMIQKSVDKIQSKQIRKSFFVRIKPISNEIINLRSNTNTNTNLTKTKLQLQPEPEIASKDAIPEKISSSGGFLIFPKSLPLHFKDAVEELLLGRDDAQIMLDELAVVLEGNKLKSSPIAWLRAVIKNGLYRTSSGFKKEEQRLLIELNTLRSSGESSEATC